MRLNYIIIPLVTLATALLGGRLTSGGMGWYKSINLPTWTPPGAVIGAVWTVLFILAAISALLVWNRAPHDSLFWLIIAIFIVNAVLNVAWSWLFFGQHLLGGAIIEAGVLGLSVAALIIFIWPVSFIAAILLVPYFVWVAFATFLTYKVWSLN
jgi:benzodiazapine receptor